MSEENLVRLSKLMSERGICSRREADDYIARGLVFVNGERISTLGQKFTQDVRITLDAEALQQQKEAVTIIVNKPIGYVSAQPEDGYLPAVKLILSENQYNDSLNPDPRSVKKLENKHFDKLAVVGRLDIDSQGLLIFTQDGALAKKIIGEDSDIEKEYIVRVDGFLSKDDLELLRFGLEMEGKPLRRAEVDWLNEDQLRFVLKEGKKRQVRRMCEAVGLRVRGLKRVRVGQLMLGNLPEGQWRFLTKFDKI